MELTLQPEDNHRLANLCGALDENLKQIEAALDIKIGRRGAHFRLTGDKQNTHLAAQLLESFYERAGHSIDLEDIQLGLVELNKLRPEEVTAKAMPL
ncbi:MAG: PhoH family protein, partial [Methylophilaceae bacterium]